MLRIRKYRRDDAREVAALISKTFSQFCRVEGTEAAVQEYVDHYDPNGKTDEEVEGLLSRTRTRLVAVADSHTVGVLRARDNRITNLFVRGDYHRQGIAARLVQRFEEACLRAGFTEVVLRSSLYATPFYEAMGYKKTTGVRNLRGLKVQPMKKRLRL